MRDPDQRTSVLVAGAGPTGLLLAAELRRRGVPCLLVDALDAPLGWDRATVVHSRSMEIFEALGLADRFLELGVKTRAARIRADGETLGYLDLALVDTRYPFDLGLSEEVTESILLGHLERQGGTVQRSTRLVGLQQGPDGVLATIEQHGGRRHVAAAWLVACDGFHSTIRDLAGIDFEGADIEPAWAVFDASIEGCDDDPDVAVAYLDRPPLNLTPLPGNRWRVYVRPTSDASDLVADAAPVIHRYHPGARFTDVENPVRFHCHSRVAARFRAGRVLLAGDAAHACTPAQGHGMNTGLQDAFNLGWKLALVCAGACAPSLLDAYEDERRPVAQQVVDSGASTEAAVALTLDAERAERNATLRRTFADPASAHHEATSAAELGRSYRDSRAVTGDDADALRPGDRLPDPLAAHPAGGGRCSLHELTHRAEHTVLVLGGPHARPADVLDLARAVEAEHDASPIIGAVFGLSAGPAVAGLGTLDADVADRLGIRDVTVLAIRPDRFVGFRHDGGDPGAIAAYLRVLSATAAGARVDVSP
ncbi:FAD-dependent monooxygenase [Capillimicrobium parvum]|uniref:3-(3-hydroxy-phenyl)propionate/3-hydroxycinnamic acid hydroxylase n=1 Tax=Capillimicrobium parvum TaxID=2884022 RepID=A0A9E6XYD2_9ACTN|nr:FAD-dependent monooxygenase [Capillimicrobium parvum]UGS36710.1 3-(3-hydroxy-phenyl)propionate/3-hydroxycinnamic acid hydroxylase [Capillimicrobium parvum]